MYHGPWCHHVRISTALSNKSEINAKERAICLIFHCHSKRKKMMMENTLRIHRFGVYSMEISGISICAIFWGVIVCWNTRITNLLPIFYDGNIFCSPPLENTHMHRKLDEIGRNWWTSLWLINTQNIPNVQFSAEYKRWTEFKSVDRRWL